MANHASIEESVLLGINEKDLFADKNIRQQPVKGNNTELLYI